MLILGIDPGSLKTGFGILSKDSTGHISHISHGTILLNGKKTIEQRLYDLSNDLQSLIEKYKPNIAAIEDGFLYKNARSALLLAKAQGTVIGVLGVKNIAVHKFSPTAIKSMVIGQGRAKKFQIAQIVALQLGIDPPKTLDASDALAAALALALDKNINYQLS